MNKATSLFLSVLILAAALAAKIVQATTIEGYTQAGVFQTVGVSNDGRLNIDLSTDALVHVIVDAGVIISSAAKARTPFTAQGTLTTAAVEIYPADNMRKQGIICNTSGSENIWLGDPSVTVANGNLVEAGICMSPDVPAAYVGALSAISTTTTATWSYIFFE